MHAYMLDTYIHIFIQVRISTAAAQSKSLHQVRGHPLQRMVGLMAQVADPRMSELEAEPSLHSHGGRGPPLTPGTIIFVASDITNPLTFADS